MHARELGTLHSAAQARASLAASIFGDKMDNLLRTLTALSPTTPATATENVYDQVRTELDQKGILLFTRSEKLDLTSPASGLDAAVVNLDSPARSAAAAAFSTLAPQITSYGTAPDGGINIWIASKTKGDAPTLLQARIPSSFLKSALMNFASGGPWSISVTGADGQLFAKADGERIAASDRNDDNRSSVIEAFADTSQFGWKVAAGLPAQSIELRAQHNWLSFALISSALAVTSFLGATLLTRSLLQNANSNDLAQATWLSLPLYSNGMAQKSQDSAAAHEQRLRLALQAGNVGVWEWNLRTRIVNLDSEAARIVDHTQGGGDNPARSLLRRVEPYDRRRLLSAIAASITEMKPLAVEVRVRGRDGQTRWIAIRGAATGKTRPSTARKGGAFSGVVYDITDQKLSLTRTDALLREVSHRSKNLLALILAMARLTARDAVNVKSHLKDFTLRVAGLAASQDLIVASDWQSVDLATLATAEIGAVARTDADRVAISGPTVVLTPEAAQTLGMVLTELALNAVEHGALSSATGEVRLSWTFPDEATISISWRETGGPPFAPDGAKGYGMSVVERFSTQGLKLFAHAAGDADAFTWTLTGPLANIGSHRESRA